LGTKEVRNETIGIKKCIVLTHKLAPLCNDFTDKELLSIARGQADPGSRGKSDPT
jgi:hypothetical protein